MSIFRSGALLLHRAPVLTAGTSNSGPISRGLKDKALEGFEKIRLPVDPFRVAIDTIAVYAHKGNAIEG